MPLTDTLRGLSSMGKGLVESQKVQWLDDADARLRAIVDDAEKRTRVIGEEATAKLQRSCMIASGIVTAGLVILAAAIAFT